MLAKRSSSARSNPVVGFFASKADRTAQVIAMRSTSIVYGFDKSPQPTPVAVPKIEPPNEAAAIRKEMSSTHWDYAHRTNAAKQIERETLNSERTPRAKVDVDGMQSNVQFGRKIDLNDRFVTSNQVVEDQKRRIASRE